MDLFPIFMREVYEPNINSRLPTRVIYNDFQAWVIGKKGPEIWNAIKVPDVFLAIKNAQGYQYHKYKEGPFLKGIDYRRTPLPEINHITAGSPLRLTVVPLAALTPSPLVLNSTTNVSPQPLPSSSPISQTLLPSPPITQISLPSPSVQVPLQLSIQQIKYSNQIVPSMPLQLNTVPELKQPKSHFKVPMLLQPVQPNFLSLHSRK